MEPEDSIITSLYFLLLASISIYASKAPIRSVTLKRFSYVNQSFSVGLQNGVTFCTVPYTNITERQYQTYKITYFSYLASNPNSTLLIFADRQAFDHTGRLPSELDSYFGPGRVIFAGDLSSGIPTIKSWFSKGLSLSNTSLVAFINSDIAITVDWISIVRKVATFFRGKRFAILGQRTNFDLFPDGFRLLRFDSAHFFSDLDSLVSVSNPVVHDASGVDVFVLSKDPLTVDPDMIPPFIMGRFYWDSWLTGVINEFTESVTLGTNPPIFHVNHKRHTFDRRLPEVRTNKRLQLENGRFQSGGDGTKWVYVNGSLKMRNGADKFGL